ncbi:hypothetical protein PIROE2DRAFT_17387, partial [Piromyces sp. E2]
KENLNRLINVFQLWGHNLYPRLKFKSIIERTEKICTEAILKKNYADWRSSYRFRKEYETDTYNTSGIIRAEDDPTAEVGGGSFNMDIFKPFPGTQGTTTTNTIPTTTTTTSTINNTNSISSTTPPVPLSRLDHPLTEEEREFMRANRERALKKLREKKEEMRRQRELEQLQKQSQQSVLEQASTSASTSVV